MVDCASATNLPARLHPTPARSAIDPRRYAAEVLHSAGSSFAFGLKMLPRPRRDAMTAVYAFSRTVDDIADSDAPSGQKLAALDAWREEIDALFAGDPQTLIGRALEPAVRRFGLPKREFLLMLDGMGIDARGPVLAPTLVELAAYTRRVAGTVGQLSVRCFGAPSSRDCEVFALSLADALQITNILRDVEEDAARGRIYLPCELLEAHDAPADPAAIADHPRLPCVCRALGAIAKERFALARKTLARLDQARLRPALIFMGVYEGYLERMEAASWRRSVAVLSMSKGHKIARGLRYAFWFPRRPISMTVSPSIEFPERNETFDAV